MTGALGGIYLLRGSIYLFFDRLIGCYCYSYKRFGQLLNVKFQSEIRPDKAVVWSPSLSVQELQVLHGLPSDVSKVTADGVRVLGVPIGTTQYKVKLAEARVAGSSIQNAEWRRAAGWMDGSTVHFPARAPQKSERARRKISLDHHLLLMSVTRRSISSHHRL